MTTSSGALAHTLPFRFDKHAVRLVQDGDQLWFVAADVMAALEYAENYRPEAALRHVPGEWKGAQVYDQRAVKRAKPAA